MNWREKLADWITGGGISKRMAAIARKDTALAACAGFKHDAVEKIRIAREALGDA